MEFEVTQFWLCQDELHEAFWSNIDKVQVKRELGNPYDENARKVVYSLNGEEKKIGLLRIKDQIYVKDETDYKLFFKYSYTPRARKLQGYIREINVVSDSNKESICNYFKPIFFPSSIAALIQKNPYSKPAEINQIILKILSRHNAFKEKIDKLIEVKSIFKHSAPHVKRMKFGTDNELAVTKEFEKIKNDNLVQEAEKMKREQDLGQVVELIDIFKYDVGQKNKLKDDSSELYLLSGECDSIDCENNIIEIKNRTKSFLKEFHTIQEYDKIQCLAYMKMSNSKKAKLIEKFTCGHIEETSIPFDEEAWNKIDTLLCKISRKMRDLDEEELRYFTENIETYVFI